MLAAIGLDQWVIILFGTLVVILPWRKEITVKFKELWEKVDMPDKKPSGPVKNEEVDLAHIINEWEDFLDLLVDNDLPNCAAEMKQFVNKIVLEYRDDLVPKTPDTTK